MCLPIGSLYCENSAGGMNSTISNAKIWDFLQKHKHRHKHSLEAIDIYRGADTTPYRQGGDFGLCDFTSLKQVSMEV